MSPFHALGRDFLRLLVLVLVLAITGCNSGGLVPVTGSVHFDGAPLKAGSIALHPDESKGNQSQEIPIGLIVEGKYEIYTNRERGALPGAYKVVVVSTNFSGS